MVAFSRPRLEGRAVEHALAKQSGSHIRMKSDLSGKWVVVRGAEAAGIRAYIDGRITTVLSELAAKGLHLSGGESPVKLPDGQLRSVDMRSWYGPWAQKVLAEVKWSRGALPQALAKARCSLGWLKDAAKAGTWASSRKKVTADIVGAFAIGPKRWVGELHAREGSRTLEMASSGSGEPRMAKPKRQSGRSNWQHWWGDAKPGRSASWLSGASGWTSWKGRSKPGEPRWPRGSPGKSNWPKRCGKATAKRKR